MGAAAGSCRCGSDASNDDVSLICTTCKLIPPTEDYTFCYNCGSRLQNRKEAFKTIKRKEGEEGWKVGGTTIPDDTDDLPTKDKKHLPEENHKYLPELDTDTFDELKEFLDAQELRGIAKMMKQKVGIIKLDDLMHASEADVDNICDTLNLKMGEKLRLKGAIKQYRDELELSVHASSPGYSVETVQLMDQLFETLEMANVEPSPTKDIHSAVKKARASLEKADPVLEGMSDITGNMGEDSHDISNDEIFPH